MSADALKGIVFLFFVVVFGFVVFMRQFLSRSRFLRVRGVFASFFVLPRSGSGARGLIKAPAGSGAGPGSVSVFYVFSLFSLFLPPFWGGFLGGFL